jgi:hypothetical protein
MFNTLVILIILYGCELGTYSIPHETSNKIEQTQKKSITYKFKIKCNAPYPILSINVGCTYVESKAMTRYL